MIIWPAVAVVSRPLNIGPVLVASHTPGWAAESSRIGGRLSDGSLVFVNSNRQVWHSTNHGASWTNVLQLTGSGYDFAGGDYQIDVWNDRVFIVGLRNFFDGVSSHYSIRFWRLDYSPGTLSFSQALAGVSVGVETTDWCGVVSIGVHSGGRVRVGHRVVVDDSTRFWLSDDSGATWPSSATAAWDGATVMFFWRRGTELIWVARRGVTDLRARVFVATDTGVPSPVTTPIHTSGAAGGVDNTGWTSGLDPVAGEPYYYYWRRDQQLWYTNRFLSNNSWTAASTFTVQPAHRPPVGENVVARMVYVNSARYLCYAGLNSSRTLWYVVNEQEASSTAALALGWVPERLQALPFNATSGTLTYLYGRFSPAETWAFGVEF